MKNASLALIVILIPVFLFSCFGGENKEQTNVVSETESLDMDHFRETGKIYADSAQKMLGMNLMKAMSEGGPIGALDFCSVRAISITDSAAAVMNIELSRVSDKPRNVMNTAEFEELKIIGQMKAAHKTEKGIQPILSRKENSIIAYYPIITQPLCLQCHGNPGKEISPETAEVIAELYPLDKATGYEVNQVRGMWKVIMDME